MRIGIIGAGQLGQMLGIAANELGDRCTFVDPALAPPAAIAGEVLRSAYDDPDVLAKLATASDVISYEFENVPVDAVQRIATGSPVHPPTEALRHAQDRVAEKRLFERLDIPLPRYQAIDCAADLDAACDAIGLPLVIKTRRLGYDGKGQAVLRDREDIAAVLAELGPADLIAEQWVPFDREVSAIGARGRDGQVIVYPLTENRHVDGILHESRAPDHDTKLHELAEIFTTRLLNHLDYVGVLALELFVVGDSLLANEFAPRVHNSGHWTIEGASASQFRNHILAITGRKLEPPALSGHAGMLNLIGTMPPAAALPPFAKLHDYGKSPRPGRKLGHITVVADSAAARDRMLAEIVEIVTESTRSSGPAT